MTNPTFDKPLPFVPGEHVDDDSIAGEEDPGASLEVLTSHPPASASDPAKTQEAAEKSSRKPSR